MAKIETVKQEVTFKLELTEKELGSIVCALRNDHIEIQKFANLLDIEILDSTKEAHLYHELRRELRGAN